MTKRPKLLEADRRQLRMVPFDLDSAISDDDPVRSVWAFVERMDLSSYYAGIVSYEGEPGRPAIDPKILLALWIQATLDGVGSAREVERLCKSDLRYQWICGGVQPNYHSLSDFRSGSADQLSRVLSETVAMLLHAGLVELQRVAQDGMKVRAYAGASSFRSGPRLKKLLEVATKQVERLRREIDEDPGAGKVREQERQKREAERRQRRIEQAVTEFEEAQKRKRSNNGKKKTEPRASTTDPQARVMKMPDGGYRPAYNVQLVSDTKTKVAVAVDVTPEGSDIRMMLPMADQVCERYGRVPAEWLVDGGYVALDPIETMENRNCCVYAPPKTRRSGREATAVRGEDPSGVAAWRTRMSTEEGKEIYRQRGATAELVNAHLRRRGLTQFLVRGLEKVRSVALLHAVAHNFARFQALGFV